MCVRRVTVQKGGRRCEPYADAGSSTQCAGVSWFQVLIHVERWDKGANSAERERIFSHPRDTRVSFAIGREQVSRGASEPSRRREWSQREALRSLHPPSGALPLLCNLASLHQTHAPALGPLCVPPSGLSFLLTLIPCSRPAPLQVFALGLPERGLDSSSTPPLSSSLPCSCERERLMRRSAWERFEGERHAGGPRANARPVGGYAVPMQLRRLQR